MFAHISVISYTILYQLYFHIFISFFDVLVLLFKSYNSCDPFICISQINNNVRWTCISDEHHSRMHQRLQASPWFAYRSLAAIIRPALELHILWADLIIILLMSGTLTLLKSKQHQLTAFTIFINVYAVHLLPSRLLRDSVCEWLVMSSQPSIGGLMRAALATEGICRRRLHPSILIDFYSCAGSVCAAAREWWWNPSSCDSPAMSCLPPSSIRYWAFKQSVQGWAVVLVRSEGGSVILLYGGELLPIHYTQLEMEGEKALLRGYCIF